MGVAIVALCVRERAGQKGLPWNSCGNDMTYTWPAVVVSGALVLILLELLGIWLVGMALWRFPRITDLEE